MKIKWVLVALLWAIPILAIITCPYDIHAGDRCSAFSHFLRTLCIYILFPPLKFLDSVDSPAMLEHGVLLMLSAMLAWMVLLTALVIFLPALVRRLEPTAEEKQSDS